MFTTGIILPLTSIHASTGAKADIIDAAERVETVKTFEQSIIGSGLAMTSAAGSSPDIVIIVACQSSHTVGRGSTRTTAKNTPMHRKVRPQYTMSDVQLHTVALVAATAKTIAVVRMVVRREFD
jgi:hypothetical protein